MKDNRKWTWRYDGKIENEIDHCLINDMRIVTNIEILHNFYFSRDHRIGRLIIKTALKIKYINIRKIVKNSGKLIILRYKIEEANELVMKELTLREKCKNCQ